jgi:hypothetical protein
MKEVVLELANAVTTELSRAQFSQWFEPKFEFRPLDDLAELRDLHVSVVPGGFGNFKLDRGFDTADYCVHVIVRQKTDMNASRLAALVALMQEIADHFWKNPLPGFQNAYCLEVASDPLYSLSDLEKRMDFVGRIRLVYRVRREQ